MTHFYTYFHKRRALEIARDNAINNGFRDSVYFRIIMQQIIKLKNDEHERSVKEDWPIIYKRQSLRDFMNINPPINPS